MKICAKDWFVVLQRPGDVLKHNGKHMHFVFNISSPIVNPTGFSISTGYLISTLEKNNAWVRNDRFVGPTDKTGMVEVLPHNGRAHFIKSRENKYTPVQTKRKRESNKGFKNNNGFGRNCERKVATL
jgi:hypothetical protein